MTQNSEVSMSGSADYTTCSNCHSQMPSDLRFCRNCGFRLADAQGGYTANQSGVTDPIGARGAAPARPKKKRRLSGMAWVFVGLLIFFVGAAAFTALVTPIRQHMDISTTPSAPKSYIGADEFTKTDEGVMLEAVTLPGGPADKAGLLGGDMIVSFDGQPIQDDDEVEDLLAKTPPGKTVDIEYVRDGEKKKTKLTTITQDENRRMYREFERRPEGRAHFGYEDGSAERVLAPGTKTYGVKINEVLRNRPADIAGVKNDDIVIEFDGVPIRTSDEFLMRIRRALPYSTVKLVVLRGETEPLEKLEIAVNMGKQ